MTQDFVCILLSGGMDSTTLLWEMASKYQGRVHAIGFDYGQRHYSELQRAQSIADLAEVPFQVISLPRIFSGAGSTLIEGDLAKPGSYAELQEQFGAQPTVVPNRNMVFLSLATTYALTHGLNKVVIGAHADDAHNYHYPDCRPAFNGAMQAAIDLATEGAVSLEAPYNWLSKADIVIRAAFLNAPLHHSQSCYAGDNCGECATCLERIAAFKSAGYRDPITYKNTIDWMGCIPFPEWRKIW